MTAKSRNILVIEDSQEVLEGIISILEYCGYQTEGVTKFTEDFFEKLKTGTFDLVILDVMLAGSDGRDLASSLKNTEETKEIPILMISAYPDVEVSVRRAGADDFLPKPFGIDELRQKIEQYL